MRNTPSLAQVPSSESAWKNLAELRDLAAASFPISRIDFSYLQTQRVSRRKRQMKL